MNGYEKKSAYGSASTAYDYSAEEREASPQRSYGKEYLKDYKREPEQPSRLAQGYGGSNGSFADTFYYGGGSNSAYLDTEGLYSDNYATAEPEYEEAASRGQEKRAAEEVYADDQDMNEDLVPTPTTMQFMNRRGEAYEDYRGEKSEEMTNKKFRINAKAKVLIAVYALVVLTIFALIILNTTLLKSLDKAVALKQTQIEQLSKENEMLNKTLDDLSSDETISQKAEEMGMVKR